MKSEEKTPVRRRPPPDRRQAVRRRKGRYRMKLKMTILGLGLTAALTGLALSMLVAVGQELGRHVTRV